MCGEDVTRGKAHLQSLSGSAVPCVKKASEPHGNWALAAYHSLDHTRPSRLLDLVNYPHVRFLSPGQCGLFHQSPGFTFAGSLTTFLALPSLESRERPAV